jgi:hypothetical protein
VMAVAAPVMAVSASAAVHRLPVTVVILPSSHQQHLLVLAAVHAPRAAA